MNYVLHHILNCSSAHPIYILYTKLLIIVPVDDLAPYNAKPSAGRMMAAKLAMFSFTFLSSFFPRFACWSPDDIIQYDQQDKAPGGISKTGVSS